MFPFLAKKIPTSAPLTQRPFRTMLDKHEKDVLLQGTPLKTCNFIINVKIPREDKFH